MSKRRIVPRSEWGAQHGRGVPVHGNLPWGEVVFHTEAGAVRPQDWRALASFDHDALNAAVREIGKMRAVEHFHAVTLGWLGFGYSFYIAYDGTVFEGRGWGYQGSHTETRNATAAGVCFEGHGDLERLTPEQVESARWLIAEGKRLGKLTRNVKISGHRDYSRKGKTCPGNLVYPIIQSLGDPPRGTGSTNGGSAKGGLSVSEAKRINKRIDTMRNATIMLIESTNKRIDTMVNATKLMLAHHSNIDDKQSAEIQSLVAEVEVLRAAINEAVEVAE